MSGYRYRAEAIQTTNLTASLKNAGRQPKSERLYVEGEVDRTSDSMRLRMQSGAPGSSQPLEVKVEDGRAFGRVDDEGEWTEMDAATDLFAPGGDPMAFLSAARNVQSAADPSFADEAVNGGLTGFTFEIDSLAYARDMRDQLEAQLLRAGKLPAGVTLDVAKYYVDMEGRGELWLNADGLPARQVI